MNLLDNVIWHALAGPHAKYAAGNGEARRYVRGFSPMAGFADTEQPNFAALAELCAPGEHLFCGGAQAVPNGWQVAFETSAFQMVWDGAPPPADGTLDAVPLGAAHVPQILELVAITAPGPFTERTIELGDYYGVFEDERLVAMAGERMHAGRLREISGVCTLPEHQGRGLARRLVEKLIRLELARDETPFLHVAHDNDHARRIYERMGFLHRQEVALRVVSRV